MASKRLETAKKYLGLFATVDLQILESLLADNYVHQFAPASLNRPGGFDKPSILEYMSRRFGLLTSFTMTAKEYVESESGNQVMVWATSQATFRDDVKDAGVPDEEWRYAGEYIFLFSMDETGEKLVRTVEFLDSKATFDFMSGIGNRALENKEKLAAKGE